MATSEAPVNRRRGGIRRHGQGWQARVSAGFDPSTGERIVLHGTVPIPTARTKAAQECADRDAYEEVEKVLTRLQAEADSLKVGRTKSTVGALLERWMAQHEIDPTTRMTYDAQIRLYIVPKLGDVPLVLFVREAAERLEPWYAQLRRCRVLCNGRPFVEKHAEELPHDCVAAVRWGGSASTRCIVEAAWAASSSGARSCRPHARSGACCGPQPAQLRTMQLRRLEEVRLAKYVQG